MTFKNNTFILKRVAVKVALVVLFALIPSFIARAQKDAAAGEATARIWFPYDNYTFSTSYMGNAQSLSKLDNAIAQQDRETVTVNIISYSSPEGNYNYNKWLSEKRANAVKTYLLKTYPFLAGRITMNPGAESWEELRANVMADARLNQNTKTRILDIIDSNRAPDAKENALKNLSEYRRLYSTYFRGLRYADIAIVVGTSAEATGTTTSDGTTEDSTAATTGSSDNATSESDGRKVVYYVVNEDEIRPAYMDNEENLLEIRRILSGPANVRNIVVVGAASPEGPEKYNQELAQRRAESFVKLILDVCPSAEGKIEVVNIGENWSGLREAVQDSQLLSQEQREEVLSIIDSNISARRKEAQLRASSAWKTIRDDILPYLRVAGIADIDFEPIDEPQDIEPKVDTLATQTDSTLVQIDTTLTQVDTTGTQIDTVGRQQAKAQRYPIVAVSTNLLYDAALAPNIAVEVPIGKKWSVYGEYTFPWWLATDNSWCYEMLKWDVGVRYRLNNNFNWNDPLDILSGHFVGLDLGAGYYDFEPRHKGYQGEFQIASLEYGYAWNLGNNWRLDAVIGAGWMGTHYRYYEADATDRHLIYQHSAKTQWFGPTKLGVSIKYIFTTSRRAGK